MISEEKFIPIEELIEGMGRSEEFVNSVLNYTSKYNYTGSINYAPENLVGKCSKYPYYGDFTETYTLRSYGKWWQMSEAVQKPYRPQDSDPYNAEDYVILRFQNAVVPRHVFIYETYNPGAVVRIWGRYEESPWRLLWEGPPQNCPPQARVFKPQLKSVNFVINELRVEFNQSLLNYYTSIDAILLGGFMPRTRLLEILLGNDVLKFMRGPKLNISYDCDGNDLFSRMPCEITVQVFQNLDLKSLCRCAQANKTCYDATLHSLLYQNLSLKPYWNQFSKDVLMFLMKRCRNFKKLDLNWCQIESNHFAFVKIFEEFLRKCCKSLTHFSLNYCEFVTSDVLKLISNYCPELNELRLRSIPAVKFNVNFTKLVLLDLYFTDIVDDDLISILIANKHLKHLNIDFCENLQRLDDVVEVATQFNKGLISWSSWKTRHFSPSGVGLFSLLPQLRELDLGWCLMLNHPGDCLEKIANSCKDLTRLIISQWRGVNDFLLLPVIYNCRNLTQLDLLGIKGITADICEKILINLPKLRLLDISFCDSVGDNQVDIWRREYPNVTIQRSCQFIVMEYFN